MPVLPRSSKLDDGWSVRVPGLAAKIQDGTSTSQADCADARNKRVLDELEQGRLGGFAHPGRRYG